MLKLLHKIETDIKLNAPRMLKFDFPMKESKGRIENLRGGIKLERPATAE